MQIAVVEVERHICNSFNLLGTSSTDLLHGAEENGGFLEMRDMADIKQFLS